MRFGSSPSFAMLSVDRGARVPLHEQLSEALRRAIVDGTLGARQRLPSTRTLALELGVSRFTVLTAYEGLTDEGYLTGLRGSGTFVNPTLPESMLRSVPAGSSGRSNGRARSDAAERADRAAVPVARDEGGLRPFRVSVPALDHFPHALWARLVARHAHRLAPAHMVYTDPAGLGPLRLAIAQHLRATRAVRCDADQVIIVSGSQAALVICAAAILRRGDLVAVEEPGYAGARAALRTGGADLVPVAIDGEGMSVEALETFGGGVRVAYITPSHQYPLGTSMSVARRLALLDWAQRHDAWLVEDDYDGEFRYDGPPLGAIQGMDSHGRVIYVGTFSKVLFPAIRVGYVVAPRALLDAILDAREGVDVCSPTLYQLALLDFLREEHFVRHLRRMRGIYARRRAALLDGLARHCGDLLRVNNADAGLHVATWLPDGVRDTDVVGRMAARGLAATALSSCYAGEVRRQGLLLGFGGSDENALQRASGELGQILRELTQHLVPERRRIPDTA